MNSPDFLTVAREAAREAGSVLTSYLARGVAVEYKGRADVVTAADRTAEQVIVERLRRHFPAHSIVAEEGGGIDQGSDYVWHIDPLDGTTNFAHGLPHFCTSIGLEKAGEGVVGVVYQPTMGELFSAERGSGAFLNSRRIKPSAVSSLEEGLFATGFPPATRSRSTNVYYFHQFSTLTHGARRTGSAALDLAYVAAGRFEGFWEFGLKSWDVSAGATILKEAGGAVSDMQGGPYRSGVGNIAASNGRVHQEMVELFDKIAKGDLTVPVPPLGSRQSGLTN
jgi:myo-inositol-1(or 4)-monophosphatase